MKPLKAGVCLIWWVALASFFFSLAMVGQREWVAAVLLFLTATIVGAVAFWLSGDPKDKP